MFDSCAYHPTAASFLYNSNPHRAHVHAASASPSPSPAACSFPTSSAPGSAASAAAPHRPRPTFAVEQPHASSSRSPFVYSGSSTPTGSGSATRTPPSSPHRPAVPCRSVSLSIHPSTSSGGGGGASIGRHPRPKARKHHSSTADKQRGVQASLEQKVDKCRGWNALFVPLGRSLPAAPPSSPVLGATPNTSAGAGVGASTRCTRMEQPMMGMPEDPAWDLDLDLDLDQQRELESEAQRARRDSVPEEGDDSDLSRSTSHSSHHPHWHATGVPAPHPHSAIHHLPSFPAMPIATHEHKHTHAPIGYFDGFGGAWAKKGGAGEMWVEDVGVMEAMDLDAS